MHLFAFWQVKDQLSTSRKISPFQELNNYWTTWYFSRTDQYPPSHFTKAWGGGLILSVLQEASWADKYHVENTSHVLQTKIPEEHCLLGSKNWRIFFVFSKGKVSSGQTQNSVFTNTPGGWGLSHICYFSMLMRPLSALLTSLFPYRGYLPEPNSILCLQTKWEKCQGAVGNWWRKEWGQL
jgi:hypothetical protein